MNRTSTHRMWMDRVCRSARRGAGLCGAGVIALACMLASGFAGVGTASATPQGAPPEVETRDDDLPLDDRLMVEVIDGSGQQIEGLLESIDDDAVTLRLGDGSMRSLPWASVVGVITGAPLDRDTIPGFATVRMATGERLPGRLEANASGVRLLHRWLGAVDLRADSMQWLSLDGGPAVTARPDADSVRLRTGDRLDGFVSQIADPIAIEALAGGAVTRLPIESVQSIAFVSGAPDRKPGARRIWFNEGTTLDATGLALKGDRLLIDGVAAANGKRLDIPLRRLAGISGDLQGEALVHRPMKAVESEQSSVLRYAMTPPDFITWRGERVALDTGMPPSADEIDAWVLGVPAVGFDGPATLRVEVSRPSILSLRLNLPRDRASLGDFELIVRNGDRELSRQRFNRLSRTVAVVAPVDPPAVEFEIIDTGGGAIQDGVMMERAMLLPRTAPSPSDPPRSAPSASP
ncbi:MAG: hypothetical protein KF724_00020 [Phycisphaeraceae bacterium]|nr:hypothetical protein [Phycisphaeraceae bacterium]